MSNIPLPDNAGIVDTFTRTEGADTVHMQAIVLVDPVDGSPLDLATEATLAALGAAVGTLNTAAAAIQAAVQALNGKTTAVDTGAIAGTVALDAPTLAALEMINAATGLTQPLTDTQLRAAALAISAATLPLPTGAAAEVTLAAVKTAAETLAGRTLDTSAVAGRLREAAIASNGDTIDLASAAQTYSYDGNGKLQYVDATQGAATYRQTYTYTAGKLSATSQWVLQ